MADGRKVFFIAFFGAVLAGVGLVVEEFELFVDKVSFFVLPFFIDKLDIFYEDSGAVFMIEVVLFEGKHFPFMFV